MPNDYTVYTVTPVSGSLVDCLDHTNYVFPFEAETTTTTITFNSYVYEWWGYTTYEDDFIEDLVDTELWEYVKKIKPDDIPK